MLSAILGLGGLGVLASAGLGIASKKFAVEVDERVAIVESILPSINCGACGYPGCSGYARAVVEGSVEPNLCSPGGEPVAKGIAEALGLVVTMREKMTAFVKCGGGDGKGAKKFDYSGIKDCRAATFVALGDKSCQYSCLGHGSCERICPFGAIKMGEDRIPIIDPAKCTACNKCVVICPRDVIALVPESKKVRVACNSKDAGAVVRKNCSVGCIACKLCVKACQHEAIIFENNLSRIDYEKCVNAKACVKACPTKCIIDLEAAPKELKTLEGGNWPQS